MTDDGVIACLDPEIAVSGSGRLKFAAWHTTPEGQPVWGRALLAGEAQEAWFRDRRGSDRSENYVPLIDNA
jgi:hypothetical protein